MSNTAPDEHEEKIATAVAAAHALHAALAEKPLRQHHLKAKLEQHEAAWRHLTAEEAATAQDQCFLTDDDIQPGLEQCPGGKAWRGLS